MTDGSQSAEVNREASPTLVRTFLFADIRGYTRFSQEFGDEAAARLAAKFGVVAQECLSAPIPATPSSRTCSRMR